LSNKAENDHVNRLAGRMPSAGREIEAESTVLSTYTGKQVVIRASNQGLQLPRGIHAHDSYEFVIPHINLFDTTIGDRPIHMTPGNVYCINPWTEHGPARDTTDVRLTGIHIETGLIQQIAEELQMKGTPELPIGDFRLSHEYQGMLSMYCEEIKYKQAGYELVESSLSTILVVSLLRRLKNSIESHPSSSIRPSRRMKQAIEYIHAHCMSDISSKEMAELTNMGWYSFIRAFRAHTGKNPHEYLIELKLEKAVQLLAIPDYTVTDISQLCGFSSHSHFSSTFKKKMGVSPSSYRRFL
jgi:AraC family transcriptional regulator